MIKLEKSGYFVLKNLGKCPVLVNDKEIAPGQNLPLTSNCLVEVRCLSLYMSRGPGVCHLH